MLLELTDYSKIWMNYDDNQLVKGVLKHGYDNWNLILEDKSLWVEDKSSK
jgi:hypothetical protein